MENKNLSSYLSSDDNKKLEELIKRNTATISSMLTSVMEVDINEYLGKTFLEAAEFEKKNNNNLVMSREVLDIMGFKPFRLYGEIFAEHMNKIIKNEGKSNLIIKKDEMLDIWGERIKKEKDGLMWFAFQINLFSLIKDIHDGKNTAKRGKSYI